RREKSCGVELSIGIAAASRAWIPDDPDPPAVVRRAGDICISSAVLKGIADGVSAVSVRSVGAVGRPDAGQLPVFGNQPKRVHGRRGSILKRWDSIDGIALEGVPARNVIAKEFIGLGLIGTYREGAIRVVLIPRPGAARFLKDDRIVPAEG